MREIKFRAWDKNKKVMTFVGELAWLVGGLYFVDAGACEGFIGKDAELMQFTGLHDKNGKEIYEGDILRWWVSSTKRFAEELLVVEWGSVGWILKSPLFSSFGVPKDRSKCSEANTIGYINSSEVIGNIYENSELLKGETP
ncbi:MAG: hypothetical protein CV087_17475 [Candidatus Brocadia sp. WS118]|nr:MAG: hypothetical protein CV087_17475 [Candidatus Brocadia sp. WS118]